MSLRLSSSILLSTSSVKLLSSYSKYSIRRLFGRVSGVDLDKRIDYLELRFFGDERCGMRWGMRGTCPPQVTKVGKNCRSKMA